MAYDTPRDPERLHALEHRLAETQSELSAVTAQNQRLAGTLREARDQIVTLKEEVDRLAQPPAGFGMFLERNDDDIGRRLHRRPQAAGRRAAPTSTLDDLRRGQEVMLNEALNVVAARRLRADRRGRDAQGGARGRRARPGDRPRRRGARRPARRRRCIDTQLRPATRCCWSRARGYVYERIPKSEVEELVLEEVPDIDYRDIGGLAAQIEQIRDAVELPVPAPRPVPRAQAQAAQGRAALRPSRLRQDADRQGGRELAGQEGRREDRPGEGRVVLPQHQGPRAAQQVRRRDRAPHPPGVPAGAREGQPRARPVIVFFDEMDSLFRTRGSGVSSDVENTIVPQLLSEIDGVESLENVLVIGASNREDMIDPAILRPGRLDVKIKIERPDAESARDIFSKYLTPEPAAARRRPGRVRRRPRRVRRRDDPGAPSSGCTPRPRRTASSRSPTPTATRRSCTSRTSTPAR